MLSAEQFVNDLHRCDDCHTLWPCGATIAPGCYGPCPRPASHR
jgi:hypothetical protein